MYTRANESEAFEALKQYLIQNYGAKTASGGKEIVKRCHICGDSKDKTDAHMYIGLNNGRIVYNCFKCNANGLVDGLFLRGMGCYDHNIIIAVQEQNKQNQNSNQSNPNRYKYLKHVYSFIPSYNVNYDEFTQRKLDYLEKRLGIKFSIHDVRNYKIVLNILEFLNQNNITFYTRHPNIMDLLNKYFVGFLSMDNTYIILRRVIPEGNLPSFIDTRYVNYNIFNLEDGGTKFYTIPSNIYTDKPLSIHIAEGVIDILSIRMNLMSHIENGLFSAICGKSYSSLIRHYIVNYGFVNFDLHLYIDNDVDNGGIIKIKDDLRIFNGINLYTHRNSFPGEKDFGVPKDRIDDSIFSI